VRKNSASSSTSVSDSIPALIIFLWVMGVKKPFPCHPPFYAPCCHKRKGASTRDRHACVIPRKEHDGQKHDNNRIVIKCPPSGEIQQERVMMSLAGKKIVLGISGGIAAYKAPELVRRLRDRGADVRVAMTEAAKAFITPLSLQAVSGYPVSDSLLDPAAEAAMGHIELGKWADLVILAPATADLIARVAAGMANDLVSTICLATPSPVAVVPAMNQQMYRAAATQHNLEVLASRGLLLGPDSGSQACGDIGPGRMLDPLTIVDLAAAHFSPVNDLQHLNIMITAGPTREPLDPVRYITNHSSGKMGFAIAAAAARRGANVTLVSGPVSLATPAWVKRIDVTTALDGGRRTGSRSAAAHFYWLCRRCGLSRRRHCRRKNQKARR
jgi:phosphopantothenoylcysteine decarboxylase/phosphopantothenate--cysteine ligase